MTWRPGSASGYRAPAHVLPLVLMLGLQRPDGGGLALLRHANGRRCLLQLKEMPGSGATGDWRKRMGAQEAMGWRVCNL